MPVLYLMQRLDVLMENVVSAILMAQAALTILEDDLDLPGGCYTPACLGQGYVDRVARQGFAIEARFLD